MSLTLDEVARQTWSVLVVGAGPAGAVQTRELARQRHRGAARGSGDVSALEGVRLLPQRQCPGDTGTGAVFGDLPRRHAAVPLREMHLAANRRTARFSLTGSLALLREQIRHGTGGRGGLVPARRFCQELAPC